jgi:hypothetical protein
VASGTRVRKCEIGERNFGGRSRTGADYSSAGFGDGREQLKIGRLRATIRKEDFQPFQLTKRVSETFFNFLKVAECSSERSALRGVART